MALVCPHCAEIYEDPERFCPEDGARLERSPDRLLGKILASRYRLIRRLGAGGMSVVYLARHVAIERLSAIKILRRDLGANAAHRERFLREGRAVNRIQHPSIVDITDVGEDDGIAYLVMEYVRGESLLEALRRGPIEWRRASALASQIAGALARSHQLGIIHRDLKPDNVMLVGLDGEELVKLMDFGIAKMADLPQITFADQLFGTPGFIAPEHVEGKPYDGRADLYSLGVVLYRMLVCAMPFEGETAADLLLKPLTTAPVPITARDSTLPPALAELVMQCLSRDPEARPRDAYVVQDALAQLLRDAAEPHEAKPESRPPDTLAEPRTSTSSMRTAALSRPATATSSARYRAALQSLASALARASSPAPALAEAVERATELFARWRHVAERASELQRKLDMVEHVAREERERLGRALDVLAADRSREDAHLAALRRALQRTSGTGSPSDDVRLLRDEEARSERTARDLAYQLDALRERLERTSREHVDRLAEDAGMLEGTLAALRTLALELGRTLAEGERLAAASGP